MSSLTQKPKAKKSASKLSKVAPVLPRELIGASSDEDLDHDPGPEPQLQHASQTPSKSQNPGILPNSSPLRSSDFLDSDIFDYNRAQRGGISVVDDDETELWIVRAPQGVRVLYSFKRISV
jgi:hypothetical protein